jgi:hypothetical protein
MTELTHRTQHRTRTEGRWQPRVLLAWAVRLAAYGVPVVTGSATAWLGSRELSTTGHRTLATITVLGSAVVVSLLVSRLTMRLMPLAVLLRMTMIFPDRAPSRVKVARISTSAHDIGRRLHSRSADESEAALTMLSLVSALGRHDRRTRGHSERVRLFCDLLSDQLKLSDADAGRLRWAALIHDIGKLEIPEAILNKPGELSEEEWAVVRRHPLDGARLARPLESWLGPWFAGIAHHHERWDGTGYPMGLDGDAISSAGRAIAVVDSFETMTAARSYKSARSTLSARTELALCAGSHFDPAMVRAFLTISLPKLLWSVGPLALLVNVPYLRWAVEGGVRTADVAAAATAATANAAGATVLAVSVGALPSSAASAVPDLPSSASVQASGSHAARIVAADATAPLGALDLHSADLDAAGHETPLSQGPFATIELPALQHADPPGLEHRPSDPGAKNADSKGRSKGHEKDSRPDDRRDNATKAPATRDDNAKEAAERAAEDSNRDSSRESSRTADNRDGDGRDATDDSARETSQSIGGYAGDASSASGRNDGARSGAENGRSRG